MEARQLRYFAAICEEGSTTDLITTLWVAGIASEAPAMMSGAIISTQGS